ncbi:MAG TPA: M23 family metallopeptidase, partial [Saprospiraceae bacterium]|nr:M23 family metallopeptidase [Saprospiraceae bacterium]
MKKGFWVFIWLCFSFKSDIVSDPTIPPVLTLVSPVRDEPSLTGSFGELRNNHFHGGIDLRASRGPNGDDILAAADGYIKKIIIDADDYGNSLYIQHPNGMVTAYCHLERFRKDIAAVVKARQYQEKRFQTELEFTPEDFPVKAGEHVAFMGNTGASRGKHLHFELRDANGEEVWDPALFGLSVKDEIAPIIKRIKVYGYDGEGNQVSSQVYGKAQLAKQQVPVGVAGEVFAVALDAQDRSNHSWNWTGIKSIQLYIDGGLFYHFSADKWKRDETKYINAHIDYPAKSAAKGNFHRCHLLS